jgi:hypothetical protein
MKPSESPLVFVLVLVYANLTSVYVELQWMLEDFTAFHVRNQQEG